MATRLLSAENLWRGLLAGRPGRCLGLAGRLVPGARGLPLRLAAALRAEAGPGRRSPLYAYTDRALGVQALLSARLRGLSPEEFVKILRPVFEPAGLGMAVTGVAWPSCVRPCGWGRVDAVPPPPHAPCPRPGLGQRVAVRDSVQTWAAQRGNRRRQNQERAQALPAP